MSGRGVGNREVPHALEKKGARGGNMVSPANASWWRALLIGPDCTLGPWAGSRRTRPPASRSRRRTRSSSGCVRPSSRRARRGSARSPGSIRWTASRSSPRRPTRSGRSSSSRASAARFARAAPTWRPTASTTSTTTGADPLFFLDYVAANRIELETVAELVEGAAEVCREAGCALIGGETAELPGIYREDELDFAGTCVGHRGRTRSADRRLGDRRGRRGRRASVGRRPRERVHARAACARGRGLLRRRPSRTDAALPRRRAARCAGLRTRSRT